MNLEFFLFDFHPKLIISVIIFQINEQKSNNLSHLDLLYVNRF